MCNTDAKNPTEIPHPIAKSFTFSTSDPFPVKGTTAKWFLMALSGTTGQPFHQKMLLNQPGQQINLFLYIYTLA